MHGCLPQNGWFIMEIPIFKWMIWGENPQFSETSTSFCWGVEMKRRGNRISILRVNLCLNDFIDKLDSIVKLRSISNHFPCAIFELPVSSTKGELPCKTWCFSINWGMANKIFDEVQGSQDTIEPHRKRLVFQVKKGMKHYPVVCGF